MAMDQYLYIPFLGGWTSINPSYFDVHQGDRVLTHPHIFYSPSRSFFVKPSQDWYAAKKRSISCGELHSSSCATAHPYGKPGCGPVKILEFARTQSLQWKKNQPSSRQSSKSRGYSSGCKSHEAYSKSLAPAGHVQKNDENSGGQSGKVQGNSQAARLEPALRAQQSCQMGSDPTSWASLGSLSSLPRHKRLPGGNRKSPKSLLNFLSYG